MTLRNDLISTVDSARQIVDDFGLRRYVVKVVRRTWDSGTIGRGVASDVAVELTPPPKVQDVPERLVRDASGTYEAGDRWVGKISASYTRSDLDGKPLDPGVELLWTLDDGSGPVEYIPVTIAEHGNFEWRATIRRRVGRLRP